MTANEDGRGFELLKSYWTKCKSLNMENVLQKRSWKSSDGRDVVMQVIARRSKVYSVLKKMHDGGHLGVNKIIYKIWKRFYWRHLRHDVEEWCQTCNICVEARVHKPEVVEK